MQYNHRQAVGEKLSLKVVLCGLPWFKEMKRLIPNRMDQQIRLHRVFIASPGDLDAERKALRNVVERINGICAKETDLRVELLGWEDTLPGTGRPQELINADLDKADLFIGCLWQRWGSPSSVNGGKTGFEEEFCRALEKYNKFGTPEIWLFFKEVEPVRRSDPGEQLQKVLAFRSAQIEAKQILFKEFKETSDWHELVYDLLLRRVFRLISGKPEIKVAQSTTGPQSQTIKPGSTEGATKAPAKAGKAFTSLAELLKSTTSKVEAGKLLAFRSSEPLGPAESARLLLFAATNYDWHEQRSPFATHEINSVYWHRAELEISGQERLYLLRTVLLDDSLTKPCWYWLQKWKISENVWLPYFILEDSGEPMREKAVRFAMRIKYSLQKRRRKGGKIITRVLQDAGADVRIAGLSYLAANGRPSDLPSVEPLLSDVTKEVRTQAERTKRTILLRANPDSELRNSIQQSDTFDDELLETLTSCIKSLSDETLQLVISCPNGALRNLAAWELVKRGPITKELAQRMTEDKAKGVRESGLFALIKLGESVDPKTVREKLADDLWRSNVPKWNKGDAASIIELAFNLLSAEALWKRVEAFDEDSPLALLILGRKFYKESVAQIRADLEDNFQKKSPVAKNPAIDLTSRYQTFLGSLFGGESTEAKREKLRATALEILADHPVPIDRDVFLRSLSGEAGRFEQASACLRGLAVVGKPNDREKLKPFFDSNIPMFATSATRTHLFLSPNFIEGARDLLVAPTSDKVWAVVACSLQRREHKIWPVLAPLLHHEDENIRRWVCYFAACTVKNSALRKLLANYLSKTPYYYNVVTLLDRALYAPKAIKESFAQDEKDHFRSSMAEPIQKLFAL